jgi:hypothetical protein
MDANGIMRVTHMLLNMTPGLAGLPEASHPLASAAEPARGGGGAAQRTGVVQFVLLPAVEADEETETDGVW